jgi:two-component system sensor histidine kinase SenX3
MHSAAGVIVGPHDEVIEATETARNLGLVRATRITASELLDLVREVRRDRRPRSQDLQINRRSLAATT